MSTFDIFKFFFNNIHRRGYSTRDAPPGSTGHTRSGSTPVEGREHGNRQARREQGNKEGDNREQGSREGGNREGDNRMMRMALAGQGHSRGRSSTEHMYRTG